MAKSFSIGTALADAFRGYGKNWMLLTLAGAIVAAVGLFDRQSIQHLHKIRVFVNTELKQSVNAHEAWTKIKDFGRGLKDDYNVPAGSWKHLVLMLVLLYLMLGLTNMCLQAGSGAKGKLGMNALAIDFRDYLRYLGACFLVGGLVALFVIAMCVLGVFLNFFQLPLGVFLLFGFALFMVFFVYMLHFSFVQFCAVDKPKSVVGLLSCSKNAVKGHLGKLFGFFIVLFVVCGVSKLALGVPAGLIARMVPIVGFDAFLVGMVMTPISLLAMGSVYRQLK